MCGSQVIVFQNKKEYVYQARAATVLEVWLKRKLFLGLQGLSASQGSQVGKT